LELKPVGQSGNQPSCAETQPGYPIPGVPEIGVVFLFLWAGHQTAGWEKRRWILPRYPEWL